MDVFKKMFEKLIENNKESSNNQLNGSLVIGRRDKESKVKESIDTGISPKVKLCMLLGRKKPTCPSQSH